MKLQELMRYVHEAEKLERTRLDADKVREDIKKAQQVLLDIEGKQIQKCLSEHEQHEILRQKIWQVQLNLMQIFNNSPIEDNDVTRYVILADKIEKMQGVKLER